MRISNQSVLEIIVKTLITKMETKADKQEDTRLLLLYLLFCVVYITSAILLQIRSHQPPEKSGTPLDMFNGSLIWAISIFSILIAAIRYPSIAKMVLWMVVGACAGAVAIDEMFEFHEYTKHIVGDDDYIKIATWPAALLGLSFLYWVERPTTSLVVKLFLFGFLSHTFYLAVDMGDGDFFMLPFTRHTQNWLEEMFEIMSMMGYLAGFIMHYVQLARSRYTT